jgi:hypothetical protein
VPNNHSKYRIPGVPLVDGTPVCLHGDHRGAGIHAPDSLAGQALDFQNVGGKKCLDCRCRLLRPDSGEDNLPL